MKYLYLLQHYEEGELILPPPRKPPDHGQRGGVENTAVEGSTSPGHFRQGSLGNGSDIQTSYVVSMAKQDDLIITFIDTFCLHHHDAVYRLRILITLLWCHTQTV